MKLGHALWAGLGVFLGVIVQSWAANADCVDDCDVSTYCDAQMHASRECLSRLQRCYQLECNKPKVVYGSIAYGEESTAWGYSFDMPDTASPDRRALSGCAARGNDCKVVVNFENSCGALAAGTNKRYATGQASEREQAEAAALAGCKRNGGTDCDVKVWSCARPKG
jgi:hypothetical protein